MELEQLVIVAVLLVLLGEVTYLVRKLPRQTGSKKRMIFVDTSVLIDGRIVPVAASGFIGDTLAIPRSVIGELQFLADNADAEKRARARHGLDIASELQNMDSVDAILFQDGSKAEEGVDERLLKLAKQYGGAICTIDYNLNKVAVVEGITVLNVNELAKNLRMAYLPGEKLLLDLVQKGQDSHQAVGYLKDGTMVVVEHASSDIGKAVEVEFIRSLQTAAGKMMFAKKVESSAKAQTPLNQSVQKLQPKQKPTGTKPTTQPKTQSTRRAPQVIQKPAPIAQPQTVQSSAQKPAQPSRRPQQRRRNDHESDLIKLVDNQ